MDHPQSFVIECMEFRVTKTHRRRRSRDFRRSRLIFRRLFFVSLFDSDGGNEEGDRGGGGDGGGGGEEWRRMSLREMNRDR